MRMCFYLQPGKRKAKKMLRLWTAGSQVTRQVCITDERLQIIKKDFTPVFYGVAESTLSVFNQAVRKGKPWLYIDNQYTPARNKKHYRVTWNALQHTGVGESNGIRLRKQYGGKQPHLEKWHTTGRHILITLQSELYFQLLMPYTRQQWLTRVVKQLKKVTDRPIVVREKPHPSRPYAQRIPFEQHLVGCYAIVTLNSATAVEGILRGIPAFVTDHNCAIVPAADTELSRIETPNEYDRIPWLETLADNQWSAGELLSGTAVSMLAERKVIPVPTDIVQRDYNLKDIK